MGDSRLKITYTKYAFSSTAYLMRTLVDITYTEPDMADKCLVVLQGSTAIEEQIVRVAQMSDLTPVSLPDLPATVDHFSAASLSSLLPAGLDYGDIIRIYDVPPIWQYFFGVTDGSVDYVVVDDTDPFNVIVDPPFPAFGRNLSFTVERLSSLIVGGTTRPTDGLASRDYGIVGPYFIVSDHYDIWDNIDDAENKFISLRGEAQALVDNLNIDNYTITLEETYT